MLEAPKTFFLGKKKRKNMKAKLELEGSNMTEK